MKYLILSMFQIKEDDGLPHNVCLRCLGTLEFLCDFYDVCHQTQKGMTIKRNGNCTESKNEFDADSDKENACPPTVGEERIKNNSLPVESYKASFTKTDKRNDGNFIIKPQQNTAPVVKPIQTTPQVTVQTGASCRNIKPLIRTIIRNKTLEEVDRQELALRSDKSKATINDIINMSQGSGTDDNKDLLSQRRSSRKPKPEQAKYEENVNVHQEIKKRKRGRPPKKIISAHPCQSSKRQYLRAICTNENVKAEKITHYQTRNSTGSMKDMSVTENLSRKVEGLSVKEEMKFKLKQNKNVLSSLDGKVDKSSIPLDQIKEEKSSDTEELIPSPVQSSRINPLVWIPSNIIMQESEQATKDTPSNSSPQPGDEAEPTHLDKSTADLNSSEDLNNVTTNMQSRVQEEEFERSKTGLLEYFERDADSIIGKASTTKNQHTILEKQRIRKSKDSGTHRKISELISDEQKEAIETYYKVDMTVVNADKVQENLTVIDKKTIQCNICRLFYPRLDKCQVHLWSHLNMRPYQCKACDFSTVTVSNVRCHIRKSHLKIKPFECHLCEKKYVTAVLLEEHMNTHTGERPFKCKVCDFASSSRQVLSYHNTTHKAVKDIVCKICGKEFYSKGRMRAHMLIHNKDKAIMCKLCSSYLSNAKALEAHNKNVHMRDYICNVCGKKLKSRKALHNHQNVHAVAKYKCTLCPNVYKSSHILKEHLLKHEGIRKYKCSVCEKSFAQQSHLAAHMAVHSDIRFHCPACQRAFNRHDNMKIHTKRCEAFLTNPKLKDLITKRENTNPTLKSSESLNTLSNIEVPTTGTCEVTNRSYLKTDNNAHKTDVNVGITMNDASLSVLEDKPNYVVLAIAETNNVTKVDESRILKEIANVPKLVDDDGIDVLVNVLGPDKF